MDLVLCDTITITSNYHIEEDRNVIMQCHTRAQGVATSHIPEEFMSSMADWKGSFGYEGIYNDEVRGMYAKIVDISPYLPASDYHGAITVDIWATISLYDSNQPGKVKLLAEVGTTLILTGLTEVQSTTSFVSLSNFPQPLIIDTFTYMDNPAMLYLRLATHNATVDLFVIIEGSTTHTGNPSPSNIHSDYWGYGDKVVHKTVNFDAVMHDTDTADGDSADSGSKARERILRDVSALQRLPNNCVPSPAVANTPTYQTRRSPATSPPPQVTAPLVDVALATRFPDHPPSSVYVLISDLDEILSPYILSSTVATMSQHNYTLSLNLLQWHLYTLDYLVAPFFNGTGESQSWGIIGKEGAVVVRKDKLGNDATMWRRYIREMERGGERGAAGAGMCFIATRRQSRHSRAG